MNKNKQFVISINRELGSGGRTVGEKLAQKLGVSFYDKALIKALEEKYNLTAEEIEALKGRSHSWWADFKRVIGLGYSVSNNPDYTPSLINEPDLLTTDEMYRAECEILNGMAADESCIIAGRSGFYIFRNHPNHLSILIQASMEQRVQRLVRKRNITPQQAETVINDYGETQFRCYVPEGAVGIVVHNGNGAQTEDITDFSYDGYWMDGTQNDQGHYIVTGWNN